MPTKKTAPKSFEAALEELEAIAARLEQEDAPLEGIIAAYERGAFLSEFCRAKLEAAQGKIQKFEKSALTAMDDAD